ncbi:hypothetical protein ACN6K4_000048 [Streptomyces hayashii]|uniref:hypothetical protein n=1 Tax=Streptomyces hayashii TaxID=2839966 RepID=UPI00403D0E48
MDRLDSPFWELASVAGCSGGSDGVGSWGPRGTCTEETLADGSSLLLTQSSNGRLAEPTRAVPPLTVKQLTAIAASGVWEKL